MKLFISYSRDDKHWVYELWRQLLNEGHYPWIDRDIPPTADWWGTICHNIRESECFLFVMSPKSVDSIYCLGELNYALALNKPILPLMLKQSDPPSTLNERRIQYQLLTDDMNIDRVLFKIEKGLGEVRVAIARGLYQSVDDIPVPDVPKPAQNPEHIYEVFAMAEESAHDNNLVQAEQFFAQVIEADPQGLGLAAKERLTEIMRERDISQAYMNVKRMADNPVLRKGAQAAWRVFISHYGTAYDPNNLAQLLDDTPQSSIPLTPPQPVMPKADVQTITSTPTSKEAKFDVTLQTIGARKIEGIKILREFSNLGLQEAKEIVESAPTLLFTGVPYEDAHKIKATFEAMDAIITLSPDSGQPSPLPLIGGMFEVWIKHSGPKKINMIKEIRRLTYLGLAEAKALVETDGPFLLFTGLSWDKAQEVKISLQSEGAEIAIREDRGVSSPWQLAQNKEP